MGRGRARAASVPSGAPGGTDAARARPLPITHSQSWSPEAPPLVGVQGATPPGGFQGGALTFLRFARLL